MTTHQRPISPRNYRTGSSYAGDHYGDNRYETKLDEPTSQALVSLSKVAPELASVVTRILTEGVISKDTVAALKDSVENINWDVATVISNAGENINWDVAETLLHAGEQIKSGTEEIDVSTRELGTAVENVERVVSSLNAAILQANEIHKESTQDDDYVADEPSYDRKYRLKAFLYRAKIFIYGTGAGLATGAILVYYAMSH